MRMMRLLSVYSYLAIGTLELRVRHRLFVSYSTEIVKASIMIRLRFNSQNIAAASISKKTDSGWWTISTRRPDGAARRDALRGVLCSPAVAKLLLTCINGGRLLQENGSPTGEPFSW